MDYNMDWNLYDNLQMDLGAVGDSFKSDYQKLIRISEADEETKKLLSNICSCVEIHIKELAVLVSKTAILSTK